MTVVAYETTLAHGGESERLTYSQNVLRNISTLF